MAMGIGKSYWVEVIEYYSGDLNSCIKYMQDHPPYNEYYFYELNPIVHFDKNKAAVATEYQCQMVKGDR